MIKTSKKKLIIESKFQRQTIHKNIFDENYYKKISKKYKPIKSKNICFSTQENIIDSIFKKSKKLSIKFKNKQELIKKVLDECEDEINIINDEIFTSRSDFISFFLKLYYIKLCKTKPKENKIEIILDENEEVEIMIKNEMKKFRVIKKLD